VSVEELFPVEQIDSVAILRGLDVMAGHEVCQLSSYLSAEPVA
jgi:hypothetical protein